VGVAPVAADGGADDRGVLGDESHAPGRGGASQRQSSRPSAVSHDLAVGDLPPIGVRSGRQGDPKQIQGLAGAHPLSRHAFPPAPEYPRRWDVPRTAARGARSRARVAIGSFRIPPGIPPHLRGVQPEPVHGTTTGYHRLPWSLDLRSPQPIARRDEVVLATKFGNEA
jgi:hypothetical protein